MIAKMYENQKMIISPKSKKIATSVTNVIIESSELLNTKQGKKHRISKVYSGFTLGEVSHGDEFKHNKKRSKNKKYVG